MIACLLSWLVLQGRIWFLYIDFDNLAIQFQERAALTANVGVTPLQLHRNAGHISQDNLIRAVKTGAISGVSLKSDEVEECETCVKAKMTTEFTH